MKRVLLSILAGAAAVALVRSPSSTSYDRLAADLDSAVGGERSTFPWYRGSISYRTAGTGEPVVLLHGINAAASSYEMRRVLPGLAAEFRVFAPDLLGFGLSDRPPLRYSAEIYIDLIQAFLAEVVGGPAHVVASSLSSAYAVRVAQAHPELVKSLVLIAPTGIEHLSGSPAMAQRAVDRFFDVPLLGRQVFAVLISRPSVRYFLRSIAYYHKSQITSAMVDLQHRLGGRPGARFAPQAFIGGRLNLPIGDEFAVLRQPVVLAWGKNAGTTPLSDAPAFLERNPRCVLKVFDNARLLPHDEQADAFNAYVVKWIREQQR